MKSITGGALLVTLAAVMVASCGGAPEVAREPDRSSWAVEHPEWVTAVALSPGGRLALTANRKKVVQLWEVATGRKVAELEEDEGCWSAQFLDEERVLLAGGDSVREWRWAEGGPSRVVVEAPTLSRGFDRAVVLPGGRSVITSPNRLCRYELETGSRIDCYGRFLFLDIQDFAVSPDGRLAATARWFSSTIRLWDVETAEFLGVLGDQGDWVMDLVFSGDGRYLVSAGGKTVRVWDVEQRVVTRTFGEHHRDVWALALTPDASRLVAGTLDGTIYLWNFERGGEPRRLGGHRSNVFNLAIDPRGWYLLSGGEDRTARLWDLRSLGRGRG